MDATNSIDLLKKISLGDEVAMREFFEIHSNTIYHYVIGRSNDQNLATEILNTVTLMMPPPSPSSVTLNFTPVSE